MKNVQIISTDAAASVVSVKSIDRLAEFVSYIDASEKTVKAYTNAVKLFMQYLAENRISEPNRDTVITYREYLKESGHKPTTIQNYITAIRQFFKWTAVKRYYPDITEHVKGAKLSREHKKDYLTSNQVKAVLSKIDTSTVSGKRNYAIIALMVCCGLRTIEVARANVSDIQNVSGHTVLFVQGKGKTEKAEYVKLPIQVETAIREYLMMRNASENEPLFTSTSNNSYGERMTTRSISAIAKDSMIQAGYNSSRLTAHSLRHTAVTLSLLAGKDITEVQQFARHSSINTTMIYNHALDKANNSCSDAVSSSIF